MKMKIGSTMLIVNALLIIFLLTLSSAVTAQTKIEDQPYVVEYYYKARWGYAEEFIRLFKKNHYPVLKKEMELRRIVGVKAESPRLHGTEEGRWDYRVTIVWKNVGMTVDAFDTQPILKQLYPDQETFRKEEQRRFEILLAHWDLPVTTVDLEKE